MFMIQANGAIGTHLGALSCTRIIMMFICVIIQTMMYIILLPITYIANL